jgi:hypothetical protein
MGMKGEQETILKRTARTKRRNEFIKSNGRRRAANGKKQEKPIAEGAKAK